jgi:surface protein
MNAMFQSAHVFNRPIGTWRTQNVQNMERMFQGASAFNQDISGWNTAKVVNMGNMFNAATSFNQDLCAWPSMAGPSQSRGMFQGSMCTVKEDPYLNGSVCGRASWECFCYAPNLAANSPKQCTQFESNELLKNAVDACEGQNGSLETSEGCQQVKFKYGWPMNSWKFGGAVNSMSSLFNGKTKFNQDISAWDVSRVTSMNSMFRNAQAFNSDISRWDTSSVTDMYAMFQSAWIFNRPIGTWTTQNVQNMERMFQGASAFNQDIRGWNTAKVVTMGEMFYQAPLFNQDISNWNVANVIDFTRMFDGASAFNRNLCAWRRYLYSPSQKKCSMMFMSSACPNKKSPLDVRFVKVQIIGRSDCVHMAEVQVYDESGNNIAIGRPATQSSTWEGNPAWGPGKAVDGNQETHDHTNGELGK